MGEKLQGSATRGRGFMRGDDGGKCATKEPMVRRLAEKSSKMIGKRLPYISMVTY